MSWRFHPTEGGFEPELTPLRCWPETHLTATDSKPPPILAPKLRRPSKIRTTEWRVASSTPLRLHLHLQLWFVSLCAWLPWPDTLFKIFFRLFHFLQTTPARSTAHAAAPPPLPPGVAPSKWSGRQVESVCRQTADCFQFVAQSAVQSICQRHHEC